MPQLGALFDGRGELQRLVIAGRGLGNAIGPSQQIGLRSWHEMHADQLIGDFVQQRKTCIGSVTHPDGDGPIQRNDG